MYLAYLIVTAATIAANAVAAIADFARAKQVLANAAELGIPESWIPPLGALKAAGAVGLLLGLLGARFSVLPPGSDSSCSSSGRSPRTFAPARTTT
jgi:DoxX-like family